MMTASRPFRWIRRPLRMAAQIALLLCAIAAPVLVTRLAWDTLENSPWYYVRDVRIEGIAVLTEAEVLRLAALDTPTPVVRVDADAIAAALRESPWVADAAVVAAWRGRLFVRIVEVEPAAVVASGDGVWLVDAACTRIRAHRPAEDAAWPVVTGVDTGDGGCDAPALAGALAVSDEVARHAGRLPAARLIHHEAVYGYTAVLADNAEVLLGRGRLEAQVRRLADVYTALAHEGRVAERVVLDGTDIDRVAVQMRVEGANDGT